MSQFQAYFGQVNGFRGELFGLPRWARTIVFIAALPALALAALSLVVLLVSILALLLFAMPVYGMLRRMTGGEIDSRGSDGSNLAAPGIQFGVPPVAETRKVEARVIDPPRE